MAVSPKGLPTAMDVAREAGVSRTTVSMVLRGEAKMRNISPATAERVMSIAQKMNYVPNQWARNFSRQRTGMIGVIFVNLGWDWAELCVRGMAQVFEKGNYTPFTACHDFDTQRARRELVSCIHRRDEAVIIQPVPGLADLYQRFNQVGIPLVFFCDRPPEIEDANFVAWDSVPDVRMVLEHLIQTGRKRIGYFGYDYEIPINQARYEMYKHVLKEHGLEIHDELIVKYDDWPMEKLVDRAIKQFFESGNEPPDAILAVNDGQAIPLLHEIQRRGIRVPDDVALAGMGDYPISGHYGINLTTMTEPLDEMGRAVAQAVVDLIENPEQGPIQRLIPGGQLKIRRTTSGVVA